MTKGHLVILSEVSLLGTLKAETVSGTCLTIAEKPRTVLFVALVLELAGLESEHLGEHYAEQLWKHTHFLVFLVIGAGLSHYQAD